MKYRTRKLIENAVDIACLVLVAVSVGFLFMKMRSLNTINYKRLYRKAERLPRVELEYYNGESQKSSVNLKREHAIFLGDLEFEGVDPLSEDEFENGRWDESKVTGSKSYYKDGKKLSPSVPINLIDYFDENYDYEMQTKKYNELIADVRKPLEYKDDSKKKDKKSNSRWGRKGRKDKEKEKQETKPAETSNETPVITPKPFDSSTAADLYTKALAASQGEAANLYPAKVALLPNDASYMGREGVSPQGVWNDESLLKIYIIPLGVHTIENYENTSALLDAVVNVLKQDPYHVFTWTEVEYFERWYHYKEESERTAIKALVTSGQLEFLLGGWSLLETENVLIEDIVNQYEEAQRWLFEEFGYRCPVAYLKPTYRVSRELASILHEGGVEMLVIDDAEDAYYNTFLQNKSVEFLWETDPFLGEESRLFTHIAGSSSSPLWSSIRRVVNNEGEDAVKAFIRQVQADVQNINDNRYLLLWPIESGSSYSDLYSFVNTLATFSSANQFIAAAASSYRYLLDVHGGSTMQFPVFSYPVLQLHALTQTGLYSGSPLLWDRVHYGSRFVSIFERFYAYCAIQGVCSNVPKVTPDSGFYSGNNFYPSGKPEDLVYYSLHRARRLQASALQHSLLFHGYNPMDTEASRVYHQYHRDLLTFEKQAGRMFATLIGIGERVSPNEFDEDSIYSIYHRTVEWTKKKEIGVLVFNAFPTRAKEFVRLRVATSDLCAFNGKMKARHQITQIDKDEYELLLSVKLSPHSYTTYILRWCEGNDKLDGETTAVKGKFLDGDVYRIQFDEFGRFSNLTNKLDAVFYDFEMEVGVVTPVSPDTPNLYKPHGLSPSDPYYLNPYIKRLIPKNQPIPFSGLRGNLMNVMIHRYSDDIHAITRFVRSVGIDKKGVSRSHMLDCSFNVKKKPEEGDLVVYFRFKDVHNNHRVHVDINGARFEEYQTESIAEEPANDFFLKNVFPAGSAAYIQDETIDRTKGDITRVSAYFPSPRGVTTMEEGSLVFPLTVGGMNSGESIESKEEEEDVKQYDLNRDYQHIAFSIQHSDKGLLSINEKVFSSIISRGHFFMYYNNTKENKDNPNLRLTTSLMKPNLPTQIQLMTFKKIDSLNNRYLLRLQNTAEWNDGFGMNDNMVIVDLSTIIKSLKLKLVEEVSSFGVTSKEQVEQQRFIWTAQDGKKSSGSVRTLSNVKSVTFFPHQIRTFVLSSDYGCLLKDLLVLIEIDIVGDSLVITVE